LAVLRTSIAFKTYFPNDLISTQEQSAKHSLLSFIDASSSQFLNFGIHDPAQIVWEKKSPLFMPVIQTVSTTPSLFFPESKLRTPFIISS
jgi:hypothetical protein